MRCGAPSVLFFGLTVGLIVAGARFAGAAVAGDVFAPGRAVVAVAPPVPIEREFPGSGGALVSAGDRAFDDRDPGLVFRSFVPANPALYIIDSPRGPVMLAPRPDMDHHFVRNMLAPNSPDLAPTQILEKWLGTIQNYLLRNGKTSELKSGDLAMLTSADEFYSDFRYSYGATLRLPTLVRVENPRVLNRFAEVKVVLKFGDEKVEKNGPFPVEMTVPLPRRPVKKAIGGLRSFIARDIEFHEGETVRVRDPSTADIARAVLGPKQIDSAGHVDYMIRYPDGRPSVVPSTLVYKDLGAGTPSTWRTGEKEGFVWARFDPRPGTVLTRLLHGAALFSSHPHFAGLSHETRWMLLSRYVQTFILSSPVAVEAERFQLGYADLIELGLGACRHLAELTVAVLREAGYDARLWYTPEHAWVVVHPPHGKPSEPWIIDTTHSSYMKSSNSHLMSLLATEEHDNVAHRYYESPDRAEYPLR